MVLGLFWLCLFICEALGQDLGHFLSNHHRSCCILAGCSLGRLGIFEASVRDSIVCIVLLPLLPLPCLFPSSFSLPGDICGEQADLLVGTEAAAGNRNTHCYRCLSWVDMWAMAPSLVHRAEGKGRGSGCRKSQGMI